MLKILCSITALFFVNACADVSPEPAPTSIETSTSTSTSSSEVDWACMLPGAICSCAAYGCAYSPSGTPDIWTPCDPGNTCYCRVQNTSTRACYA